MSLHSAARCNRILVTGHPCKSPALAEAKNNQVAATRKGSERKLDLAKRDSAFFISPAG